MALDIIIILLLHGDTHNFPIHGAISLPTTLYQEGEKPSE